MIELAVFFLVISAVLRPLGADYADVANATLSMAGLFAVVWLVAGAVALVVHRPPERRIPHHA